MADQMNNGEDLLLVQIDAFREKALQLQNLILAKENQVSSLEAQVAEMEAKNVELQNSLTRKQIEADALTKGVEKQVDSLLNTVTTNMDELQDKIGQQVADNEKSAAEQTEAFKETLSNMSEELSTIKGELGDKVHSENVQVYRNIQDLMKELDKSEEANALLTKQFKSVKGRVTASTVLIIINMIFTAALVLVTLGIF